MTEDSAVVERVDARDGAPGSSDGFSVEEYRRAYEDMLRIRRFEEKAGQLYGMGLIGGFCHLYIGQEAVVVGAQMALREGDQVITGYRDHGHMLATGMDPKGVMAELTGRASGYSKGKGGSMHMFSVEKHFYGGHGIVGGQVYESFNMAKLWSLPVVYMIENNKYGMGTSVERASSTTDLSQRGRSFDIPGEQVDGMSVEAVNAAVAKAVNHARSGKGPYILELLTYRYRGHSMSDPAKYRTRDEVNEYRQKRDPIEHVREILLSRHNVPEDDVKAIDKRVREEINAAAEFAQSEPEPDPSELWTDVVR